MTSIVDDTHNSRLNMILNTAPNIVDFITEDVASQVLAFHQTRETQMDEHRTTINIAIAQENVLSQPSMPLGIPLNTFSVVASI